MAQATAIPLCNPEDAAHHPIPREASERQEVHHQLGENTDNHATSIPHDQSNLQMPIPRPSSLPPAETDGNQLAPQFGFADSPSLRSTSHFGAAPTTSTDGHLGQQSYSSSQLPISPFATPYAPPGTDVSSLFAAVTASNTEPSKTPFPFESQSVPIHRPAVAADTLEPPRLGKTTFGTTC